jgi:hypothetical protein
VQGREERGDAPEQRGDDDGVPAEAAAPDAPPTLAATSTSGTPSRRTPTASNRCSTMDKRPTSNRDPRCGPVPTREDATDQVAEAVLVAVNRRPYVASPGTGHTTQAGVMRQVIRDGFAPPDVRREG